MNKEKELILAALSLSYMFDKNGHNDIVDEQKLGIIIDTCLNKVFMIDDDTPSDFIDNIYWRFSDACILARNVGLEKAFEYYLDKVGDLIH